MHSGRSSRLYEPAAPPALDTSSMDPDCAICSSPATFQCDCEAKGLDTAVRQAEARMMSGLREWVRMHAQDYILHYFELLTKRRKEAHAAHMENLKEQSYYYRRAPPHHSEIAAANAELKRGIDADWRSSVQKYPEVLEYYFSLVTLQLPRDEDPAVRDPPLSALTGAQMPVRPRTREMAREREIVRDRAERSGTPGGGRRPEPPRSGFSYGRY